MRAYARRYGEDEELWAVTGLVHDLDYERYPDLETGHPRYALKELEERGYPQEVIDAVAGHADFLKVPRETLMAKGLYAVDEMSGFVTACALVRPTGIEGMKPKSVRKKMKQPSFAAKVPRDQLERGAEELGRGDERAHPGRDRRARRARRRAGPGPARGRHRRRCMRRWVKVLLAVAGRAGGAAGAERGRARPPDEASARRRSKAGRSSICPAATCRCSTAGWPSTSGPRLQRAAPAARRRSCCCTATPARSTGGTR